MTQEICASCIVGWHHECDYIEIGADDEVGAYFLCCDTNSKTAVSVTPTTSDSAFGRALKDATAVKDATSTGRKRAVILKPIKEGDICEWVELRYAGGGVIPIVGCRGNPATNVHHGPDKDTLNNNEDNLHKVCATCHNRWHTINDPFYPKERPPGGTPFIPEVLEMKPHDADTKATEEEIEAHELKWSKHG